MITSVSRYAARLALMISLAVPQLVAAQSEADKAAGDYLAGRSAMFASDFETAARHFTGALMRDRSNQALMDSLVTAQLALGEIERAYPVAERMEALGAKSQFSHLVIVAHMIAEGDYAAILERETGDQPIGHLVDGLVNAWAHMGKGSVSDALAAFDALSEENGLRGFALYHKALALSQVGDFEGAEALFAGEGAGTAMFSRRGAIARAEILSQLGRNDDALNLLVDTFGSSFDPGLTTVADRLASGETLPFSQAATVRDGMAEVFYSIGNVLNGEIADDYALIYARIAIYLRPDHIDSLLLAAQLLDNLGQYDLAIATYKQVPADSPDHHAAELGRAEALRRAAKPDAAIEVLEQLTRDYPTLPLVHSSLGDLFRQQEEYASAVAAYDRALEFTEAGDGSEWFLRYARGISHERLDQWEQAEADFRTALELRPDQPQVLNYLGYSLVEKRIKLDEALEMIERAVEARPDSGFIVDSLGWVLYRLGRYDEAVGHMERAVELMPVDPVVNDHLGDVLWAVDRKREAEFQWKRALSFIDPEDTDGEADPDRIRRKLEVGLDVVLAEEGSEPLKVANGDD